MSPLHHIRAPLYTSSPISSEAQSHQRPPCTSVPHHMRGSPIHESPHHIRVFPSQSSPITQSPLHNQALPFGFSSTAYARSYEGGRLLCSPKCPALDLSHTLPWWEQATRLHHGNSKYWSRANWVLCLRLHRVTQMAPQNSVAPWLRTLLCVHFRPEIKMETVAKYRQCGNGVKYNHGPIWFVSGWET